MPSPPKRMHPSSYEKPAPQRSAPSGVHYEPAEDSGLQMQFPGAGDDNTIDVAGGEDLLAVGRWVEHPAWGRGQIVDREGSGSDTKLSIRFGGTTKRVIAAYAQLQPA